MFKLMYLYVDQDGLSYQSDFPPNDLELSCVATGILKVFRWYANAYEEVRVGKTVVWEKVETQVPIENKV